MVARTSPGRLEWRPGLANLPQGITSGKHTETQAGLQASCRVVPAAFQFSSIVPWKETGKTKYNPTDL